MRLRRWGGRLQAFSCHRPEVNWRVLYQFDDLGMFRRIPPLEQLGQPCAARFGQAVHGGQAGRCQIHVVIVATLHHDTMPAATNPRTACWMISG